MKTSLKPHSVYPMRSYFEPSQKHREWPDCDSGTPWVPDTLDSILRSVGLPYPVSAPALQIASKNLEARTSNSPRSVDRLARLADNSSRHFKEKESMFSFARELCFRTGSGRHLVAKCHGGTGHWHPGMARKPSGTGRCHSYQLSIQSADTERVQRRHCHHPPTQKPFCSISMAYSPTYPPPTERPFD